jgi:hypothetical protein
MWNLPKGNKFLPKTTLKELETLYTTEKKAKPKTRLLYAIHRKKGASIDNIAQITNQKKSNSPHHPTPLPTKRTKRKRRHKTNRKTRIPNPQTTQRTRKTTRNWSTPKQNRVMVHQRSKRTHPQKIWRNLHKRTCMGTTQSTGFFLAKTKTPQNPRRTRN